MGPYVIGVMFAFFLQDRKQRGRDTGRVPVYILWPLYGAITMLLFWPVYGTKYLYDTDRAQGGFTKWGNVFYISLARSGWALGIGLLATLAYWGYGGIVRCQLLADVVFFFLHTQRLITSPSHLCIINRCYRPAGFWSERSGPRWRV